MIEAANEFASYDVPAHLEAPAQGMGAFGFVIGPGSGFGNLTCRGAIIRALATDFSQLAAAVGSGRVRFD